MFFFFRQKTAYEMRISDWSSDVCSSDLGLIEKAKDLLLDRLDDTLEPLARVIGGKAVWDEMKENALLSTTAVARGMDGRLVESGGAAQVARLLDEWAGQDDEVAPHLAAPDAGPILLAPPSQLDRKEVV